MYERKETQTDDLIRRFSSPRRRRSRHGVRYPEDDNKDDDSPSISPVPQAKTPLKVVLFLLIVGIALFALLYFF